MLVGASFGGWIAAEMAVRSTARLGAVALIGAFGVKVGDRESRDIADFYAMPMSEWPGLAFSTCRAGRPTMPPCPTPSSCASRGAAKSMAYLGWKPFMHNPQLHRWLHRIDVPTLVLWGAEDRVATPDYGRAYAKAIRDADFLLVDKAAIIHMSSSPTPLPPISAASPHLPATTPPAEPSDHVHQRLAVHRAALPRGLGCDPVSLRVTLPNRHFDPVAGADLLNRYLDEWALVRRARPQHHGQRAPQHRDLHQPLLHDHLGDAGPRDPKGAAARASACPWQPADPVRVAEEMAYIDVVSARPRRDGLRQGRPLRDLPRQLQSQPT